MKFLLFITPILLFGCTKTNEHNFIEREKDRLNHFILQDVSIFDNLKNDTLIISLQSLNFCGNDPAVDIDCSPMFNDLKSKALIYGFKTVLLDTFDLFDFENRKLYKYCPRFSLHAIIIQNDSAYILQAYSFLKNPKHTNIIKDTTIEL